MSASPTSDRERWDARWGGERGDDERPPDPFVLEAVDALGPGGGRTALDLAAGTGRHALALAERGWRASAWDVSPVGLARLAERAAGRGLLVETRAVDLLARPWPALGPEGGAFALVVAVDFHDEGVWGELGGLVAAGGHAVVATFTVDWPGERPSARFRLARGRVAGGLAGLETVRWEERDGRAGLVARRR